MNNALKYGLIFVAGAAAGAAVSWKLLKTTYERIADEEIESVKETFAKKMEEIEATKDKKLSLTYTGGISKESIKEVIDSLDSPISNSGEEISKLKNLVSDLGYKEKEKGGSEPMKNGPRVIPVDEYGEEDYELVTLQYYADGVLTNDFDEIIEPYEIPSMVGEDFMNHFGDDPEDPDTVYICNDEEQTYYEILMNSGKYSDLDLLDDDE